MVNVGNYNIHGSYGIGSVFVLSTGSILLTPFCFQIGLGVWWYCWWKNILHQGIGSLSHYLHARFKYTRCINSTSRKISMSPIKNDVFLLKTISLSMFGTIRPMFRVFYRLLRIRRVIWIMFCFPHGVSTFRLATWEKPNLGWLEIPKPKHVMSSLVFSLAYD